MSVLQLDEVSLVYTTGDKPALSEVSLDIRAGEFVAAVGPSGCGKSSTISLLAGLIPPSAGRILMNGRPLPEPGPDRAVVFQDYSLFPWMTAGENIRFALRQIKPSASSRELAESAATLLDLVGLSPATAKYPAELSGGMRQRVAIARAFAQDAPVYLLDEPFGAVDAKNRIHLQDLLLQLWTSRGGQKTVFLVTHDIDEALYLADRIVVFTPGPGRIRKILPVPFPRPRRRFFLVHEPAYIALRNEILSLLQQELLEDLQEVEGGTGI
ncbi:MAG TPA: ABC transporter ATP-binding protein [Patescibacteria group bacterium]|nr:ABC transporter ATP-binding protein [Patescibacteria group bacterium]